MQIHKDCESYIWKSVSLNEFNKENTDFHAHRSFIYLEFKD